jgi:hypothetical protein
MRKAAEAFFYQVFRDGFFHADMHGGNAFVDRQGCIVPVDFGIMGRVDEDTRGYLAELLVAFLRRDYRAVAEVQFRAGYVPAHHSTEMFAQACRSIGEPIFGKPSHQISIARLLAQLLRVTEQFEMTVQPQLLLLQKTMLMAEGMGTRLNPRVNIWELARPLIEDWMRDHFGPRATARRGVGDLMQGLRRLPRLLDSLHLVAEHERQKAERASAVPAAPAVRTWRIVLAEIVAVVALVAAAVVGYEVGQGGSDGSGGGASSTVVSRQPDGITVKMVSEGDGGKLHLSGVDPLPSDKVLEAWVEREGKVEAVPALFVPDRKGQAETTIEDLSGVRTVMVTKEPSGGSEAPTGEPIVTMSVPQ